MTVFLLEWRNLRKSNLTSTVTICGVIFLMLLFFPSMQTESMKALAGAKLEGIDPAILEALGLTNMMDFTVITNYFGYVLQYITLAVMVIVTQRAVLLLSKEEADGTIEYLYSKPVSRDEIFLQKVLALLASLFLMTVSFMAVTVAGYLMVTDYRFDKAVREAYIFYGSIFFVGLVFSSVGILISALLRGGKGTGGITIGIVFGTFILGIASLTVKQLEFLIWFSPMDWIKALKLMTEGILPEEWAVGIAVMTLSIAAAWTFYRKKDLLV
ncbi:hypothetical protein SDC9_89669 [bioreactor metagenome]|uniref:Uncharacterized protein n=1 Tax=bioreactor metagenome TaxID=1076179 RepID=A0A644ZQG8_9ZZZZ